MPTIQLHALEQIVKLPKCLAELAEAIANAKIPKFVKIETNDGKTIFVNVNRIVRVTEEDGCTYLLDEVERIPVANKSADQVMETIRNA